MGLSWYLVERKLPLPAKVYEQAKRHQETQDGKHVEPRRRHEREDVVPPTFALFASWRLLLLIPAVHAEWVA